MSSVGGKRCRFDNVVILEVSKWQEIWYVLLGNRECKLGRLLEKLFRQRFIWDFLIARLVSASPQTEQAFATSLSNIRTRRGVHKSQKQVF